MFKTSVVTFPRTIIVVSFFLLTACGGGGSESTETAAPSQTEFVISGAAIKGPLAHANVELYALDASYPELYEPGNPVAVASTDAYAQITGLSVSRNLAPPYVMVIDGSDSIDLNTQTAPVIDKLITVITEEDLRAGQPAYATPYTTLAYQMLRLEPKPAATGTGGFTANNTGQELISIEAEHYAANLAQQGGTWEEVFESGISGAAAMQATGPGMTSEPNYADANPQLNYPVVIGTPGKYYVWVRVIAAASNANSLHIGLDDQAVTSGENLKFPVATDWSWQGGPGAASIDISAAGAHTLNVWLRETRVIVDKIVLTTDPNYVPSGTGPAESVRAAGDSDRQVFPALVDKLDGFSQKIIQSIGFGMPLAASIFSTPPIITQATADIGSQQLVVQHRAAIEAFSSMLHQMYTTSTWFGTDALIQLLAFDLHSDGVVDARANGTTIGAIKLNVLAQDPMQVEIANTNYTVAQIVDLMAEERSILGVDSNVYFYEDRVNVALTSLDGTSSTATSGSTNTIVDSGNSSGSISAANTVLHADFEHLPTGAYRESDLRSDFRVGAEGYNDTVHGPDYNSTDIVSDPADSGRGKVLRVLHRKGEGSIGPDAGGLRWRADLPPADAYYFAYDYYVPSDWWQPLQHKMPALINGTLLEASHAGNVIPSTDTLVAFNARIQSYSNDAYARGDGSLASVVYDKDSVQRPKWLNTIDPISESLAGQYHIPRGRWIKIEQYVKLNTDGQKNGALKIWVDGKLMYDHPHRWLAAGSTRQVDGIYMYSAYGGNGADPRNQAPRDQYQYYDNFVVSDSPITH